MVDYNVTIPSVTASNAMNPMALMQLQQRNALGQGRLDYMQKALELKQQQVDNALANAGAGRAKSDYELNQMKAVRDVLANRVSPAVIGVPGIAYSGTGVSTDPNEGLYNKLLETGDVKTANEFLTGQKTAVDTQSAVTKSIDDRLNLWKNKSPSITSAEDAAAFSLAMQQDPLLSQFSHLVGDPQAAAAKSAALFDKDPVAWHTSMANLTGDQFITAIKPKIETVGAGQNVVAVSPSGTTANTLMTAPAAATAPSTLAKLISERDALPAGDSRKDIYDAMIKKETTASGQTINVGDQTPQFNKSLGEAQAKKVVESQTAAKGAANQLDIIAEGEKLLNSGIYTGTGATFQVGVGQALQKMGFTAKDDAAANAQAYGAIMGKQVGEMVKQFGSGTSISDGDRIYAERMAAGDINLDEQAMRKILRINKEAALKLIRSHNKTVSGVKSDLPLTVGIPASAAPPAEAVKLLKSKDNAETRKQFDQWYGEGAAEDVLGQ